MSAPALERNWADLLAAAAGTSPGVAATGRRLIARWAEESRGYHDLTHLQDVLANLDDLGGHEADAAAVRLAAWYHDAVYAGAPDDEERSARLAESELAALRLPPALVAEVARLVRLTASHDPAPGDRNGEALCDADLAVLAAAPEAYGAYVRRVRAEYAHVAEPDFRAGRARALRALLGHPSLFRTPAGRTRWEAAARANVDAELRALEPRGAEGAP